MIDAHPWEFRAAAIVSSLMAPRSSVTQTIMSVDEQMGWTAHALGFDPVRAPILHSRRSARWAGWLAREIVTRPPRRAIVTRLLGFVDAETAR